MSWDQTLFNLRDSLADLYPTIQLSMQVIARAQVPDGKIAYDAARLTNWFNILHEAKKHKMVGNIVKEAHEEYPEQETLRIYLERGELPSVRGPDIEDSIKWNGSDDAQNLEKIIGSISSLLPISFLEVGLQKARSVARIVRQDGGMGTGFLIGDNLLVTNNHVLGNTNEAAGAKAQFNYQLTAGGLAVQVEEFSFLPQEAFATSQEDDWTVVKVQGNPNEKWGALELKTANPQVNDWVNIIQHPMGEPKQIALYHNVVVFVGQNRVQYLTDTMPGSSGSPVFDSKWNVVALHHSGGKLREPGTNGIYYRNEGIHINVVIDGKKAAGL